MNDSTVRLHWLALAGIVLVASVLGGVIVAGIQWGVDKANEPTTSIENTLQPADGGEPTLDEAVHAAAVEAVEVEGGRFKGETFEIARIEVTADNPHIKAYRVILERE
jgi:hypothetical protein